MSPTAGDPDSKIESSMQRLELLRDQRAQVLSDISWSRDNESRYRTWLVTALLAIVTSAGLAAQLDEFGSSLAAAPWVLLLIGVLLLWLPVLEMTNWIEQSAAEKYLLTVLDPDLNRLVGGGASANTDHGSVDPLGYGAFRVAELENAQEARVHYVPLVVFKVAMTYLPSAAMLVVFVLGVIWKGWAMTAAEWIALLVLVAAGIYLIVVRVVFLGGHGEHRRWIEAGRLRRIGALPAVSPSGISTPGVESGGPMV